MNQEICHTEYRIVIILADDYIHYFAILLGYNTVDCKRKRYPLPFFDATVIMGVKICKSVVLIQWILFYVKTRRIDVRTENIHTLCQRLCSDLEQGNGLLHAYSINLVTRF